MSEDQQAQTAREAAADAALRSLVANLISLGLTIGLCVAISQRDTLARQRLRVRQVFSHTGRRARERRLIAELQADVSHIEHGTGPDLTVSSALLAGWYR